MSEALKLAVEMARREVVLPSKVQPSSDALVHDFRKLVFAGIARAFEIESGGKSYEGTVELTSRWPNYFEANGDGNWGFTAMLGSGGMRHKLELHCYVLGPGRHYDWDGTDIVDVFARATADVTKWIAELEDER